MAPGVKLAVFHKLPVRDPCDGARFRALIWGFHDVRNLRVRIPNDCFSYRRKKHSMDLEQQANLVNTIHDTLSNYVDQRLKVRANMGRSKIVESEGVLTQVHPRLFVMEVDRKRGRTARQSYQYVDILTGAVELSQNGEPIFEPFVPQAEEDELGAASSDASEEASEEEVLA